MPAKKSKKKPRKEPLANVKKSKVKDSVAEDERIANIFHLADVEELPPVTDETLEIYYQYFKNALIIPFQTIYKQEIGFLQELQHEITVIDILNPTQSFDSDFYGIFCESKTNTGTKIIPLAELELDADDENYLLIDDYSMWFWNYRE